MALFKAAMAAAALLLTTCIAATAGNSPMQFIGDQVLAIKPSTAQQVQTLQLWRENGLHGKGKVFLDFWSSPGALNREVQVHVQRSQLQDTVDALARHGMAYRVAIADLARLISLESEMNKAAVGDHSRYLRYDEYTTAAGALISKCGSQCSSEVIGKSHEGRDIIVYKLGSNGANPIIFMDGGVHAREWIGPATLLYFIDQIISNPTHRSILNNWNLAIVAMANPDGYEYSHTKNRMWRKNRRGGSVCYGVDLNRNFEYVWGGKGTSSSPCSDIYRGPGPFSEPETQAIRDFMQRNKAAIRAALSVHSYGQYWLHPYGYDYGKYPDNVQAQLAAAKKGADAIHVMSGRRYTVGSAADVLYPAAGASDDWAASIGIPYAYTIELPDTGRYGFALPPSYIVPVGQETLAGLEAFLRAI